MAFDENSHYIDNIRNFLEYENKTPDNINGEPAGPLEKMTFRNVSFSYEGQGMERKEAMKKVASDRGISKREVYQSLLS